MFHKNYLDVGMNEHPESMEQGRCEKHKKTTQLQKRVGKEKDTKTALHLLVVHATDAG